MTKHQERIRSAASGAFLAALLIGCGGSHSTTTPTPPPPAPITGIVIPSNTSVVTATNSN